MSKRNLILAIDGGGSSSQVALCIRHPQPGVIPDVVLRAEVGPLSCKSSDTQTVLDNLITLHDLIADYEDYISIAVLGLSGLDDENDFDEMASLLYGADLIGIDDDSMSTSYMRSIRSICGFPIVLCSDALLPLFACDLEQGAVLIAGTGSIALRVYPDGEVRRFGGWSYRVSDEGSGCWIGSEFVRQALYAAEGILSAGSAANSLMQMPMLLKDAWIATVGADNASLAIPNARIAASDICLWALNHDDPKDFARIARFVLESRSPEAMAIVDAAATRLARLAALACRDSQTLVVAGGLFSNKGFGAAFGRALKDTCGNNVNAVRPNAPITYGAYELGMLLLREHSFI